MSVTSEIIVTNVRFEQHHSGFGVSTAAPRISWSFRQVKDAVIGWEQSSYEVEVVFGANDKGESYLVESPTSVYVPWPARGLRSRESASVRVRCYGSTTDSRETRTACDATGWSEWSRVEAALLSDSDWTAQWIAASKQQKDEAGALQPIKLLKSFSLPSDQNVRRAKLYITARGCYEAFINGGRVGDERLSPGWQSYKHRLHYQIFDVTQNLSANHANELSVTVAAGWYASALAWAGGRRCFFGDELSLLAQLMVEFEDDDKTLIIHSDDTWTSAPSPNISAELYTGVIYDQSLAIGTNESNMDNVRVVEGPKESRIVSPDSPPVRITQSLKPQEIFRSPSGKILMDFGQNLVGRLHVKSLTKPASTKVSFAHAEVLENGELGRRPLRYATSTDTVICNGSELKDWAPEFTFHGFRYVEVVGWTPDDQNCPLTENSVEAQVLHTDLRRIGHFECSHPLINKLHTNAMWSMRGNFLSLPTDCPQRDERLGWTGDIQVFAPSASFLYDTTGMLGNWLEDLAAEQLSPEHGGVPPFVVPDVISQANPEDEAFWIKTPNAVWDDAAVLIPWSLHRASGDPKILERQLQSMTTWLDRGVRRGADNLWDPELYQLGDWLDPIAPPSEPGNGRTNGTLVADAYLVHVTGKVAEICKALIQKDLEDKYTRDYEQLIETFQCKYITRAGLIVGDSQTAMALAIMFDLLETPEQRRTLGDRLARAVRLQQFRVATGFAGTPIILHALSKAGYPQHAYRMLLEKRCPSWMYAVSMGATTIWERWDSMLPDGSINPGEMTSFNHYALGSVVNWLHEYVSGISPLSPGWKEILVRPVPGGDLRHAKVSHHSPYGLIECEWKIEEDDKTFVLQVTVPPNSRARIVLPGSEKKEASEEQSQFEWVGSGFHTFQCALYKQQWPPEAIMPPFWPQPKPVLAGLE